MTLHAFIEGSMMIIMILLLAYQWKKQYHSTFLLLMCIIVVVRGIPIIFPKTVEKSLEQQSISFDHLERISDIKKGDKSQSFIAQLDGKRYTVFAPENFQIGLSCQGSGEISTLSHPSLSLQSFFISQQIEYQLQLSKLKCNEDYWNIQFIRDEIRKCFTIYGETGELYFALLFGGTSGSHLIQSEVLQTLGIIHLISLSGLQVNMLLKYLSSLYHCIPLGERGRRWINTIFLIIYAILCIHSLAFIRVIIAKLFELWLGSEYRILFQSITTLLFLIIWPTCYYNIGFWFSFIMQCTLIYLSIFTNKYKIASLTSFVIHACILFLQTVVMSFLYQLPISPLYLLANIVSIPIFEYIICPMLFLGILCLPLQQTIINMLSFTQTLLEQSMAFIQNRYLHNYEFTITVCVLVIIIYFISTHTMRKKITIHIVLSTLLLISSMTYIPRVNTTTLIFMNVGQGDSSVIFLADSQTLILIDTGPPNSHYLKHLKSILYQFGKTHVDYLIITHADNDHAGNAKQLIENVELKPKKLLLPNTIPSTQLTLLEAAQKGNTYYVDTYTSIFKEEHLNQITLLNPGHHLQNENEESIVLQLQIGKNKILYQADAGVPFEQIVQHKIDPVTLLKVAHHGSHSGSSEEYIRKIHPEYSIISAGKHNHYGHPHPDVINHLKAVQSTIIQTSSYGDITFQCNDDKCYQTDAFMV